jgi:hypothetical protein
MGTYLPCCSALFTARVPFLKLQQEMRQSKQQIKFFVDQGVLHGVFTVPYASRFASTVPLEPFRASHKTKGLTDKQF